MNPSKILEKILKLFSFYKGSRDSKRKKVERLKKVAICVGHSRIGDKGATSVGGVSEWSYNKKVADVLKAKLRHQGIQSVVFDDYPSNSYGGAMEWLAQSVAKQECDIAVELHFNSYSSSKTGGYEYLHYHTSDEGRRLAECFRKSHSEFSDVQSDRGVKARKAGGRAGGFLRRVPPPAVVCEPFFGSCPKEWILFDGKHSLLAEIYSHAIVKYFRNA
jgi:N-acetylmuramoyl-L-alanine amidase